MKGSQWNTTGGSLRFLNSACFNPFIRMKKVNNKVIGLIANANLDKPSFSLVKTSMATAPKYSQDRLDSELRWT